MTQFWLFNKVICTLAIIVSMIMPIFSAQAPTPSHQAQPKATKAKTNINSEKTNIELSIQTFLEKLLTTSQAGCTEFTLGKQPKNNLELNPMLSALAEHKELIINTIKDNPKNITIQFAKSPKQHFKNLGNQQFQFCYAAVKLSGFNFYKAAKNNIYQVSYDYDLIPINSAFLAAAKKMGPLHISDNKIELKKTPSGFKQSSKLWDNN
ncbi:hypothetical protein [Piscirickettsia litoralis]|uniref:DUF2796 domain-containing protein n=1 Tax=Piscirickettsia litoralis TaxID=1891921 RepID=A0ABX3AAC3_9GAMM|nr:hypothetical protein [Piscirickettsia litoralis]ODN43079.1 hypothetical protein BGC07_09330 [Piscirickettsia litoralis]